MHVKTEESGKNILHVKTEEHRIRELAWVSFLRMCPAADEKDLKGILCSIPIPRITCTAYSDAFFKNGILHVGSRTFLCEGLLSKTEEIGLEQVIAYGMCIPEADLPEDMGMLEAFYCDCYMTALLEAGREWLREYLKERILSRERKQAIGQEQTEISESFGPGFYGMGIESISELLSLIQADAIGLREFHGAMYPDKSSLGFYLVLQQNRPVRTGDCAHCLGQGRNCIFCHGMAPGCIE